MPSLRLNNRTVHFSGIGNVTHIGGISIPEAVEWCFHPQFIAYMNGTGIAVANLGDIRSWLNEHWSSFKASAYSDFLLQGIGYMLAGVNRNLNQSEFEALEYQPGLSDETVPEYTFDPRYAGRTSFLLFRQEQAERPIPREVRFSLVRVNGGWAYYIRPPAEGERGSEDVWSRVMNYTFTPDNMPFLAADKETTHLYFGMELEMSTRLTANELQRINTDMEPKRPHWFYFKQDSSVSGRYENQMEMVTVPMSPKRMRQEWRTFFGKLHKLCEEQQADFRDFFDLATDLNNGIHIHVSKAAFVQSHRNDHRHKYRFLAAFNQWEQSVMDFMQKISKRPSSFKGHRYCMIHPGLDGYTLARRLKNGPSTSERHAACHEGGATVEVRIFQGIPDLEHILSCVDLTEAMFNFCQYAPHSAYGKNFPKAFSEWVFGNHGYKHAKEVLAQCVS